MKDILNLDTVLNEPREINHVITGRKFRPWPPFWFPYQQQINVKLPDLSLRDGEKVHYSYIIFLRNLGNKPERQQEYMINFMVEALKYSSMPVSRRWIRKYLSEDAFVQIFDFLAQPRKTQLEDQLKNLTALQNVEGILTRVQNEV